MSDNQPRTRTLDLLWKSQQEHGCIRDEDIREIARATGVSDIELEGVATFYHFFHRQPAGRHTIYLNDGIISRFQGFEGVKAAFEAATGARTGGVNPDGTFGLYRTPCIGLSDQEPAALIDFYPFTHLSPSKAEQLVAQIRSGMPVSALCDTVEDNIRYLPAGGKTVFFRDYQPGRALANAIALGPEGIIDAIRQTALAGRGGAFYPTWQKWEACRRQPATPKYVICNADEGEPGTFKDRVLMNRQPESVLEGMLIAALATGASAGIIYLRAEYRWLLPRLESAIGRFRDLGLLGDNAGGIPGFRFDISLQSGAGSYVCGEETALLESLEGKRGEPRTKWFFPVEQGYLRQPTLINNVETFSAVANILDMGADEYNLRGIHGSPGTKLISVSGDCRLPGLYEIEWGMTVGELLEHCEAEDPSYLQVSGPSGECISMAEKDRHFSMLDLFSRKDIRCGGSFMVFNRRRDIVSILLNFSEFFLHESCGVCTPCRAGNFILHRKLEKIARGLAREADLEEIRQWGAIMKKTSRCGLGKTAPNSLILAMEKFHDDLADRLDRHDDGLNRAFDTQKAIVDCNTLKNS